MNMFRYINRVHFIGALAAVALLVGASFLTGCSSASDEETGDTSVVETTDTSDTDTGTDTGSEDTGTDTGSEDTGTDTGEGGE
jgi:hypothetical protein